MRIIKSIVSFISLLILSALHAISTVDANET